jgi:hypothetical protein
MEDDRSSRDKSINNQARPRRDIAKAGFLFFACNKAQSSLFNLPVLYLDAIWGIFSWSRPLGCGCERYSDF